MNASGQQARVLQNTADRIFSFNYCNSIHFCILILAKQAQVHSGVGLSSAWLTNHGSLQPTLAATLTNLLTIKK